ncbi:MAG: 2'-5' RNA ligase family protein [Candidatus Rokubacteria bacterium]|nr:2'-5' RNA ligase family protein [Candidatus Rokubacteria bacterium]MBI3825123.1 2'-5' RNA ligase family protein [Candidatus Rokubacteria bacterium]
MSEASARFVRELRGMWDVRFRDVVECHFTLVFGIDGVEEAAYRAHVRAVVGGERAIPFTCRRALIHPSDRGDYHAFLVPDEGRAAIARLHDRLYTGPLAPCLRRDLPYVPHITVAAMPDAPRVKALCDELNAKGLEISGVIDSVSIGALDAGRIRNVERIGLES